LIALPSVFGQATGACTVEWHLTAVSSASLQKFAPLHKCLSPPLFKPQ
jgi:hypothetical protein